MLQYIVVVVAAFLVPTSKGQTGNGGNQYESSSCNAFIDTDDTRPLVGQSCKVVNGTSTTSDTDNDNSQATPALAVFIQAGGSTEQIRFTTYPTNMASSVNKPTIPLDISTNYQTDVSQWPYCAGQDDLCYCKTGRIALIFEGSEEENFIVTKVVQAVSVKCSLSMDMFQGSNVEFRKGSIQRQASLLCTCARAMTTEQQWQWATDLCPPLSRQWRGGDDFVNCQGGGMGPMPYDAENSYE